MTAAPPLGPTASLVPDGVPLDRDALAADLRGRIFPAPVGGDARPRIGAEVEIIPIDAATRRPLPLDRGDRSTLAMLREAGAREGWRECHSAKAGVPEMVLGDCGRITFEPGGQIEISAAPDVSLSHLVDRLRETVAAIESAAPAGVVLRSVGIDPETPISEVAPQLHAPRYRRMLEYFDSIGPSGARMMRQTASFQVCVDGGEVPELTWRVLNALAPYAVAMFANSPRYAGRDTGHRSFRREIWATLDPRRTGLLGVGADPVEEYLDFALAAPAFLMGGSGDAVAPFARWVERDRATAADWCGHLSTLFPEVRPRGYFELRSIDVVPPEWYPAPLALVCGLAYHPPALEAAADLLGAPDPALLARCGRVGLGDARLRRVAPLLADLALDGCVALGDDFIGAADLERAAEYFDRYTRRGRALADG